MGVLHRLCGTDEVRYLALLHEALRVAAKFVFLAEDVIAPLSEEAAFRRWKSVCQAHWSVPVLLDFELRGGSVADHFLSGSGKADCPRRCLILDASASEA